MVAEAGGTTQAERAPAPQALDSTPEFTDFQELFSALGTATEALRRSHDELNEQVKELELELAQKNRALERKRRLEALGKIAAGVAHEIRNPLGSISLYIDLLESELTESARARGIIGHVKKAISYLSNIVNDILTFTEPGKANLAAYEPAAMIEEAIGLATADAPLVEVARDFPRFAPRRAVGDPDWLRRIFVNLLRNACQAMPAGGRLGVALRYGDEITVRIRDTGPGIPADELEKVFLPFWGKRPGGTGLGLSIVLSLIERHHGSIELANHPEGGLEAMVTIPWQLEDGGKP